MIELSLNAIGRGVGVVGASAVLFAMDVLYIKTCLKYPNERYWHIITGVLIGAEGAIALGLVASCAGWVKFV